MSFDDLTGMFERAFMLASCMTRILNLAFMSGSSKHGNDLRASVASIWEVSSQRRLPDASKYELL